MGCCGALALLTTITCFVAIAALSLALAVSWTALLVVIALALGLVLGGFAKLGGEGCFLYLLLHKLFDAAKIVLVVDRDEGDGASFAAGTCGTAYAVYVVVAVAWHVVVYYKAYVVDVYSD